MSSQRYVSRELTHFVGRGKPEQQQYSILLSILREGVLKSTGSDFKVESTPTGQQTHIRYSASFNHDRSLSSNEKYQPSVVCFADIPTDDLNLHIRKYSPFGLSFRKPFLLGRGANPVLYVAGCSSTHIRNPVANKSINTEMLLQAHKQKGSYGHWENFNRAELFDAAERAQQVYLPLFPQPSHPPASEPEDRQLLREFLGWYLFPYMKFFNAELPDEHIDNYYMEREWRAIAPVPFGMEDVERILMPRSFAQRFREDAPPYFGQLRRRVRIT